MLWCALATGVVLTAAVLLVPAMAPGSAKAGEEPVPDSAGNGVAASNFGSATPSDKFVQSFQQQVTQQLQSAIAQANDSQETKLRAFEQQQRELNEKLQALQQSIGSGIPRSEAAAADYGGGDPTVDSAGTPPPQVYSRRPTGTDSQAPVQPGATAGILPGVLSGLLGATAGPVEAPSVDSETGRPMAETGSDASRATANSRPSRAAQANIAPHGFVEGRLLNGVVAILGGPDRESIVALSGHYQSANGFLADLDGCFALVQGKPEIASGRIDFKLSRLTCNFSDGASRTWDTAGWLVDSDGIRGVRARIVENSGRKAAVAAAGGALAGVGMRLSQQQYQITTGPVAMGAAGFGTGASASFTGNAGRDALGGAASGGANTIGQSIGDYYNLYAPSLQVGGGTPVTVVLANDLRLPASAGDTSQTHLATP